MKAFSEMDAIFNRTKGALDEFMGIITPVIESAADDHERLYWHHIYEEEEHRSDRLEILTPRIQAFLKNGGDVSDHQHEFLHLLQDISIEKFGLHNFLEHLDLSLFRFNGTELEAKIQELRDFTYSDYQEMKKILETLNEEFNGAAPLQTAIPTDEKDGHGSVKIDGYAVSNEQDQSNFHQEPVPQQTSAPSRIKGLTIGSLKP